MNNSISRRLDLPWTFLFLFVAIALIVSCSDNESPSVDIPQEIVISHQQDLYVGSISGVVVDENSDPLQGVTVSIGTNDISSDENGYFSLQSIELDAQGTVVTARLDNYWTLTKMVTPSKLQQNHTRMMLRSMAASQSVVASEGGVVNFEEEIQIDFPKNAFVNAAGEAYDGAVKVSSVYLDPDHEDFGMMSPGDFRAFNSQSELQTLVSLGMAGVELRGADNEKLQLGNDKTAVLSIKVPSGAAETEVPLWHFDESSGYWLEEGVATKVGEYYVGNVSHFSWWNCDIPFTGIRISGTIVSGRDMGVTGLPITMIMTESGRNLGEEYTGNGGFFTGWIPKGETLTMQLTNECGGVFYEATLGPLEEDTVLPPINISTSQNIVEVCGNLVDCDDEAVTDGYLIVRHQSGQITFIPVDGSGDFCSSVNICEATSFDMYGLDLTAQLQGLNTTFDFGDSPFEDVELRACDQVAELFTYKINDEEEIVITDFRISLSDSNILAFAGNSSVHGVYPTAFFEGTNWGNDDMNIGYWDVGIASPLAVVDCDAFICNQPSLEFVEYGGIDNPLVAKISGTSDEGDTYLINVSGILRKG